MRRTDLKAGQRVLVKRAGGHRRARSLYRREATVIVCKTYSGRVTIRWADTGRVADVNLARITGPA